VLWDLLDDFVLVSDEELLDATAAMITGTRNLVEPAGAASLAGAIRLKEHLAGRKVAVICSGGNLSPDQVRSWLV
jgi:threonine dehydratase